MRLDELFRGDVPEIRWTKQGPMHLGSFEIEGLSYLIQLIKMSPKDPIHSMMPRELITDNTWFFSFAAIVDGRPVDTATNAGNTIPIFSAILQTLQRFIRENKIDTLYLGCSDSYSKLKGIYKKLIARYTKAHDWEIHDTTTARFFGDKKYVWILTKAKTD